MWQNVSEVTRKCCSLKLYRVDKGKRIGDTLKYTAHKLKVEPYSRHPSRKVSEKRAADSTYLLVSENTSAEKPQSNIKS